MQRAIIKPQEGRQTQFLASRADITFYGGAAGGGKTYGELLDPLRHRNNGKFRGVIFRRTTPEITMPGGLLDTAKEIYMPLKGAFRNSFGLMDCSFPSGWRLKFAHLQYADTIYQYQGLQVDWQAWDELTHFLKMQFMYLATRGRSVSGIKTRILGTTNPDPDSWVKEMILWWLDSKGQYADPKKAGIIRYFITDELTDSFLWFGSRKEILKEHGPEKAGLAKSFTFIPSDLSDNKILMKSDPRYKANLAMQDRVTRARLMKGDWLIRAAPGTYFRRDDFTEVDHYPELIRTVRFWDRAATELKPGKDQKSKKKPGAYGPDHTCSVKMGETGEGKKIIVGLSSCRKSAGKVETLMKNTAIQDGVDVEIGIFQDPGSAGKGEAERTVLDLDEFSVTVVLASSTGGKETNAKSFSAQSEHGNVEIWSGIPKKERDLFYSMLEAFPSNDVHDDYVDAGSGAYNMLTGDLDDAANVGIF